MRPSGWAVLALLLLVSSIWLPWWHLEHAVDRGTVYHAEGFGMLRDAPAVQGTWVFTSLTLCILAAVVVLIRVAASSWIHEPRSWRRDLWIASGLVVAAALVALLWPEPSKAPAFWSSRRLVIDGLGIRQIGSPALGWWLAWAAAVCIGWAAWSGKDRPGTGPARHRKQPGSEAKPTAGTEPRSEASDP